MIGTSHLINENYIESNNKSLHYVYWQDEINPIQTVAGGGGRLTPPQTKISYYSRKIASTVFLLRDFSSHLPGNNLLLLDFGS